MKPSNPPLKENQLARLILTAATLIALVTMVVTLSVKGTRNEISLGPGDSSITVDKTQVNAIRDIGAGLKGLVGGELVKYNEMMGNARALATKRMVEDAEAMGADAIIGLRYTTSSIMQGAAEVLAYGTAVKFV